MHTQQNFIPETDKLILYFNRFVWHNSGFVNKS